MRRKTRKWVIVATAVSTLIVIPIVGYRVLPERLDPFLVDYRENCAVCHGYNMEGAPPGPPLVGVELEHGDSVGQIERNIRRGFPDRGMPGWLYEMDRGRRDSLAILIAEKRLDFDMGNLNVTIQINLPDDAITSEEHAFRLELFADALDPMPYSIAPMPDGGMLLTEKKRGISVISPAGIQSPLIEGTQKAYDKSLRANDMEAGLGWSMEAALHPDYETNGWVYLHYSHMKSSSRSLLPVTMNRLDRGRIRDGQWTDVATIWQAGKHAYTSTPEIAAGGRIAFDGDGHVFISVGIKGGSNYEGIQDLEMPYGKIHRINDDGSIPGDNPFVHLVGTAEGPAGLDPRQTTWTYGHRTPQGLEFNPLTGDLWGSEMGPRGGDEVNLLLPGRNYGWPLTSLGVDYNGTPVEYGKDLGIEFDMKDIEQPVVDFSPSPAISSFVFYRGDAFPKWRNDILIGSLKAATLYRLVIEDDRLVHKETLIKGLARIRDIEVGYDGLVYLLLENKAGSKIVRLVPRDRGAGGARVSPG